MMNVVIERVLRREPLERIPGDGVAAVIVDGLEDGQGDEPHCLAGGEARDREGEEGADDVDEEGFQHIGVKCAEGVGHEVLVGRGGGSELWGERRKGRGWTGWGPKGIYLVVD